MTSRYAPTADELEFAKQSMPVVPEKQPSQKQSRYAPTEQEMEFAQQSMSEPVSHEIPWYKSFFNAARKGSVKGLVGLGESIGSFINEDPFGERGNQFGQVFGIDTTPKEKFKPIPQETKAELNEDLKKNFPTNEGFAENVIERTTELAPVGLIGPGGIPGKLARTGLAATLGQGAKELGFGQDVQTAAEIAGFVAPNPTRIIQAANPRQQQLLDFGRSMGMTEEQMAPLMNENNWFTRALARFSKKSGRAQDALSGSNRGLSQIYNQISISPEAQITLTPGQQHQFVSRLVPTLQNLPVNLRNEILPDLIELAQGPFNGHRMINFYQDVGDTIDRLGRGTRGRRLGGVLDDMRDAIGTASPQVGEEISMTNDLYTRYARMRDRLRPGPNEDLINSAKGISSLGFLITGRWDLLKSVVGYTAAKRLATEFLVNPRLVNIQHKMLRALNENQVSVFNELKNEFSEAIKDTDPEYAELLGSEEYRPTDRRKKDR